MRNITIKPSLLLFFWLFSLCFVTATQAGVVPQAEEPQATGQKMSKKEMRKRVKTFKQSHKSTLKGMKAKDKRAYIKDGISSEQFIAGAWFPIGLILILVGALLGLLFAAPIAWVGLGLAIIGLGFLIYWLILEINSGY